MNLGVICILLSPNILNKKVSQIYFFQVLNTQSFWSIDAVSWYKSCRLLYDISDMFFIASPLANLSDISFQ